MFVRRRKIIALCLVISLTAGSQFAAEDRTFWPQFHGPHRDNRSSETGLLPRWPAGGPPLAWSTSGIGHGFSSVSVAAERIFTAGNIEDQTVVTALNMKGRILWQTACGKAWTNPHGGTRGTPRREAAPTLSSRREAGQRLVPRLTGIERSDNLRSMT
jgi:hypothetical protein